MPATFVMIALLTLGVGPIPKRMYGEAISDLRAGQRVRSAAVLLTATEARKGFRVPSEHRINIGRAILRSVAVDNPLTPIGRFLRVGLAP